MSRSLPSTHDRKTGASRRERLAPALACGLALAGSGCTNDSTMLLAPDPSPTLAGSPPIETGGPPGGFAGGHGEFIETGMVALAPITFSFQGIQTGEGIEARGRFQFRHASGESAGTDLTVQGEVHCLHISANSAVFFGVVTWSNDDGIPAGQAVLWSAVDNDEAAPGKPDLISVLHLSQPGCAVGLPQAAPLNAVQKGNVEIR